MKVTILVDPSFVIITRCLLCLFYAWELEIRFIKKKMHCHYITYMATPLHKNPCTGGHNIYNFGRPFFGHHFYTLSLYRPYPKVEKKIFFKYTNLHFLRIIYLPLGWRSWNLQFLVSLTYRCHIPDLVNIGSVVLEKMLRDDAWQTTDANP